MAAALLFDIGNVLVTFDFSRCARRLAEHCEISEEAILGVIAPLKDPLESGQVSAETFVAQCLTALRFKGSREDFWGAWCDIFTLNEPMAATLASLPATLPAYLLSNTNGPHKDWLLSRFPVFQRFVGGIYSHEAGCMKPGEEIYHAAMKELRLVPEETFYVDDLIANIETGRRLGFVSYHYDPADHSPMHEAIQAWAQQRA
jgi:glucose-1-phosphatase